ncbi:hypothetical protein BC829DRAFT_418505 [Chytridium lagenaria]|nr:hypothetical protein BC829DRAFT_418505 [Chytridium lagenaria]
MSKMMSLVSTHLEDLDDSRLVTSHHLTPEGLRAYRAITFSYLFAYTFANYFYDIEDQKEYAQYFAYFTHFSWLGLVVYFALATYNVHVYIKSGYSIERLKSRHPVLRWIFWNSYVLNSIFHVVIPIVYWVLLVDSLLKSPASGVGLLMLITMVCSNNIHVHGLTTVWMILEMVFSRVPLHYSQWTGPMIATLLFVAYSQLAHIWFTTPQERFWAYPFLDTSNSLWYVWYAGVGILFLCTFMAIAAIHRGRDRRRERLGMKVVPGRKMTVETPTSTSLPKEVKWMLKREMRDDRVSV